MREDGNGANDWKNDLEAFFDEIDREDGTFAEHVERAERFYHDVARPALDDVGRALDAHGRSCEVGADAGRIYIIVRRAGGEIEFQYAVVVEAKVEGVTPYAHCWYEQTPPDDAEQATEQPEDEGNNNGGDEEEGDDENDDRQKEPDGDEKDDKEAATPAAPKRIKTVEVLGGWTPERGLDDVSRDDIARDFLGHYKQAVARLRAHLHEERA